jgi:hypothetical protein
VVSRTGRTSTREPGRKARISPISTVKPPLTLPLMRPVTVSASKAFSSTSQAGALGLFAREAGGAEAVLDGLEGHFHLIADLHFQFAVGVQELAARDDPFGLESGVDDHVVVGDLETVPMTMVPERSWVLAILSSNSSAKLSVMGPK